MVIKNIAAYRKGINLDEPPYIRTDTNWQALLTPVLNALGVKVTENTSVEESIRLLHGELALVEPYTLPDDLVSQIETIAVGVNHQREIVEALALPTIAEQYLSTYPAAEQTSIWVGDITQLRVDAIVNAANTYLLGCRIPNHACIDNAIHSGAGPRLRDDCATIIAHQQKLEPVGCAKITRAYALPTNYILHTVGPQLPPGAQPNMSQRNQLENAYLACLDVAASLDVIESIAFCAISTGVFGYPKPNAAEVALTSVADWLSKHPKRFRRVIFNLYSQADARIYEELLNGG